MKIKLIILVLSLGLASFAYGQQGEEISTIDFVQILDGNDEEAVFYYQKNWKVLREMALKKKYIKSFQLLKTEASEEAPFQIMLITNYANAKQYSKREKYFAKIIKAKGELDLLNDKKPAEFRKVVFGKEAFGY